MMHLWKQALDMRCCFSVAYANRYLFSETTSNLYFQNHVQRRYHDEVTDVTAVSSLKRTKTELPNEFNTVLKFAKLSEHATTPTRGSTKAAGYDLYSAYDYSIGPMDKGIVKTDIQIAVPHGCYGRVAPRSGLAAKHFIDVGAGVVDEDYRGNVGVVLFNFSKETFNVKKGDRVAQLVCERICYPDIVELQTLDETERGSGGFGSTGRN
ncbi:deoxyuridine 5'-triphosphate nucleotidohydrolase, mitochondrial isoform X1 [Hypomesus transpacificus]|uniref:deoxyuridine 5'-triphosphate nucleotidohydrolase, mitochondrial isoform X1 n=1 Tax=Hypomesus transpacificus TaxID=137520 RepID=UPI001F08590D|nr:deoxyuridine 5'-triphosphate nucleotidohydrolase, mitochondrial isoform X1 [Hypomesus transpacificus]